MNDARTWLGELLEALERHAQLIQANTAAVSGLQTVLALGPAVDAPAGVDLVKLRADLLQQLVLATQVMTRLAQLHTEVATSIVNPPAQPSEVLDGPEEV